MGPKQILILIGVAVYYYLRYSSGKDKTTKKPVQRPSQPKKQPVSQPSLEELLRNLTNQVEEPVKERKPKKKKVKPAEPIIKEVDHHSQKIESILREEKAQQARIELIEDEDEDDFDLRQAVINDVILNRPQY